MSYFTRLWERSTVGPDELIRLGFVFMVIGILFFGVGVGGGIMVSTGVFLY